MKKRILMIAILAAGFLLPPLGFCKGDRDMPREGWWRRPGIAELIKLTPEEKGQLEAKYEESRRKRLDLKATLEKEQFELDILFGKNTSGKEIMAQYAKMEDAKDRMGEELFRFIVETRDIIGHERFLQIKELAREWRGRDRNGQPGQQLGRNTQLSQPNTVSQPSPPQEAPSAK